MRLVSVAMLLALAPATALAQSPAQQLANPSGDWDPSDDGGELAPDASAEVAVVDDGTLGDAELGDRLRVLDATWGSLARSGDPNWLGIILSFAAGAAQMGFGIAFTQFSDPGIQQLAPYFITLGTVAIVRTIVVDLIMRPDARTPALEYQHMPSITRANRLARLEYGERQLDSLAEFSLISRIVDASLNIAGAGASLIAYFAPDDGHISELEAFIFIGPAISLIMAIVTLASPTEAEQRRDAYHRMRRTLSERRGQRDTSSGSYDEDVVPPPPGAGLRLQLGGGVVDSGGVMSIGGVF